MTYTNNGTLCILVQILEICVFYFAVDDAFANYIFAANAGYISPNLVTWQYFWRTFWHKLIFREPSELEPSLNIWTPTNRVQSCRPQSVRSQSVSQ